MKKSMRIIARENSCMLLDFSSKKGEDLITLSIFIPAFYPPLRCSLMFSCLFLFKSLFHSIVFRPLWYTDSSSVLIVSTCAANPKKRTLNEDRNEAWKRAHKGGHASSPPPSLFHIGEKDGRNSSWELSLVVEGKKRNRMRNVPVSPLHLSPIPIVGLMVHSGFRARWPPMAPTQSSLPSNISRRPTYTTWSIKYTIPFPSSKSSGWSGHLHLTQLTCDIDFSIHALITSLIFSSIDLIIAQGYHSDRGKLWLDRHERRRLSWDVSSTYEYVMERARPLFPGLTGILQSTAW